MGGQRYTFTATPAARSSIHLRAGICGAGGSGKTYSALAIACALAERLNIGPVYAIDSEHKSLLRYAYSPRSGKGFKFQHVPMPDGDYSPHAYMAAFDFVIAQGAKVVLVDSLSHEWDGANGMLEQVDKAAEDAEKRGRKPDNFSAWRTLTPLHKEFIESLLSMPAHVMFTLRAKMTYEARKDDKGRMKFEKVGLGPIQREGIEYEPDLFFWMNDAILTVDKTRCDRIAPGSTWEKPGADFAALLADWIEDVEPAAPTPPKAPAEMSPALLAETAKHSVTLAAALDVILAASKLPKVRAVAWRRAVDIAKDTETLDAIECEAGNESVEALRADVLKWIDTKRASVSAGDQGEATGA